MSNTYVKKYDVGQIKLDLPYAHYIHELPLLSFGDIQHTINLSLVFNSERKKKEDNSFSIADGFKLNLQKRIVFDQCANRPIALIDATGKYVVLYHNEGDVYTFGDDSQRILRKISNTYEVEYPDFSKETYNQNGYITATFDKYSANALLTFSYTVGDRLSSINYGGNKVISFTYEANRLASVSYAGCNIKFNYNNTYRLLNSITHYSGVSYTFDHSSGFMVRVIDTNEDSNVVDSLSVEVDSTSKKVTVTNHYGDNTIYEFSATISPTANNNVVTITDNNGVKTRTQYQLGKLLYSYEIGADAEFVDDAFSGNITIYDTLDKLDCVSTLGIQTRYDGIHMYPTGEGSTTLQIGGTNYSNAKGYYLLTGWAKGSDSKICISNHIGGSEINIFPHVTSEQWHYFAYKFYMDANIIYVYPWAPASLELKDVRITYQSTHIWDQNANSHVAISDDILVHYNGNGCTYIPLNSATIFRDGLNIGNSDNICFEDVLKYKINQKKQLHTNEFYVNKLKKIIPISTSSNIVVSYNGTTYNLNNCYLAKRQYVKENQFVLSLVDDHPGDNLNSFMMLKTLDSNQHIMSTKKLDNNLDVIESTEDVIAITYERNNQGLITKETASGLYRYDTTYSNDLITVKEINIDTEATISTTKYHLDTTWGGVEKIEVYDASNTLKSIITNTCDGDMSVLTGKSFGSRTNSLSYSAGKLDKVAMGDLRYQMAYDNGNLSGISKYNALTNSFATIETHTHSKNNGETTVVSQYPSEANPLHTKSVTFDKYGRLKEVEGVLINSYDIWPTFTDIGGMVNNSDNGSALLGMTADLLRNETSRYKYNSKKQLVEKAITKTNDFSNKISTETFEYDDIGRLTRDHCVYDQAGNKFVTSVIQYEKSATDPDTDGRVNRYSYYLNGEASPTAQTGYEFDDFKRVSSKFTSINGKEFIKKISYDKARLKLLLEMLSGRPISIISYGYDAMGRISSANDIKYTYDTCGQLVKEYDNALDKTTEYVYNGIGNIMSVTTRTGNSAGSTKTFGYDEAHPDRLASYNGKTITYNANGGVDSYDGWNYSWSKGKLSSISKTSNARALKPNLSPTKTYSFTYNALGQRVTSSYSNFWSNDSIVSVGTGEVVNYTKQYKYDHVGRLLEEIVNSDRYGMGSYSETLRYLYDDSSIVGVQYTNGANTNAYYFLKNLQGDVIAIYDANGAKVVTYSYDAWGNCTIDSTTTDYDLAHANPIRYRGYYYDEATKLYYLNARYYSPEFRRFISPDDTNYLDPENVNGLNLYCYCNNDPVNYCDPSGHFPLLAVILGITATVGLGISVAGVATNNNLLTAIGLTAVAAPALITGGIAAFASTGALAVGIGTATMLAGGFTGIFAGAEYQEAFTDQNFILNIGISDALYNTLMLTTAGLATLGTFASSFAYHFNINSIDKIGTLESTNYKGIRFTQKVQRASGKKVTLYRTLEWHTHSHLGYNPHWQLNKFSYYNEMWNRSDAIARWTWWLTQIVG